jgi:hypothetical protein
VDRWHSPDLIEFTIALRARNPEHLPADGSRDIARAGYSQRIKVRMFRRNEKTGMAFLFAIAVATACIVGPLFAQTSAGNAVRLSDDIVPAPDGFEAVTGKYVAAKATDVYISPFIWAGKVAGLHLNAGQPVEVLAKLKGYDWLLIGNRGEGIGYVPIAALVPAK